MFSLLSFFKGNFSLEEALIVGKPLTIFIIGMVIYAVFIFKFYRSLATRDIFKLNLAQYSSKWETLEDIFYLLLYIVEHLIIFPLFTFFWFIIISLFIVFLSREQNVGQIFTYAMAIVATVRISAYYNEELARDIAKTLPLTLLGIFLFTNLKLFSPNAALLLLKSIPLLWKSILYYLLYIVLIEIILRVYILFYNSFTYSSKKNAFKR